MKLVDVTLNIHPQAWAVAHILSGFSLDEKDYQVYANTHAWYNGRERAMVLTVTRRIPKGPKALHIVWGEGRNHDGIFVDTWTAASDGLNPPSIADWPESAYRGRKCLVGAKLAKPLRIFRNWWRNLPA